MAHVAFWELLELSTKKQGLRCITDYYDGRHPRTLEKETPPVFGMIQRCGQVVIQMFPNVQQTTIEPLIKATIQHGTLVYTYEYAIYNRLDEWGYDHENAT